MKASTHRIPIVAIASLILVTQLATRASADASSAASETSAQAQANQDIADRLFEIFAMAAQNSHENEVRKAPTAANLPMHRPVFSKAHGCLQADFIIDPKLPPDLKQGVFSGSSYPAWIRFSNDGAQGPDSVSVENGGNPARGLAIKLIGVAGPKLLPGQESAVTQDFILENLPAFFAANARDFLAFNSDFDQFMKTHPHENDILNQIGLAKVSDPLETQYWTPTPYSLGNQAMKYSVKPCGGQADWQRSFQDMTGDNYLRENLLKHVARATPGELCLDFYIQIYKSESATPIDDATHEWTERASFPIHAARIQIRGGQDLTKSERIKTCESLSFNGWHAIEEHRPLGSLNEVRKIVYQRMSEMRKTYNNAHGNKMRTVEPVKLEDKP